MQLIYGENFSYPHPHVTFYLEDRTQVDDDAPAPADTVVLVTGIVAPRGLDDGFIKFEGPTGASEFKNMFGDISIKKHGLTGFFAEKTLENGGSVIARRVTPEDASLSNSLVTLNIETNDTVTFYVDSRGRIYGEEKYEDSDGQIYDESTDDTDPIDEVTIPSYEFNFTQQSLQDVSDPNEIEVDAAANLDTDLSTDGGTVPLYGFSMLGRGNWGNSFKLFFTPTRQEIQGHKVYNYQLADTQAGEVFDDYDISHVPDLSENGVPVNLPDIISRFSSKIGMTFFEEHYEMFDEAMTTVLEDVISELETIQGLDPDSTDPDPNALEIGDLQPLIDKLNEELSVAQSTEELYLNNMEVLGGEMFKPAIFEWTGPDAKTGETVTEEYELDLNLLFPNQTIDEIALDNGHNGCLSDMKRFDWEYTLEDSDISENSNYEAGDTPLVELFSDLYAGSLDPQIMDLLKVDGDIILDVGYPLDVKKSISGLVKNSRQDMAYIMGIPTHIRDIEMLDVWTSAFNPENVQMMKIGQTCEWRDPNGKIHRIPISALLYLNLIDHFMNGYDEPFAGDNVYISGIQPGSIRPETNGPDDRADMEDMGYNVVMENDTGYFLDGQITNYKQGYSRLKEFFNIPIKGRLMKTAIPYLEGKKHKLQTPDAVEKVRKNLERNLKNLYGSKVSSISVEAGFRNEQEQMRGDVTIRVYVAPYGSIKRFRLLTYIVPNI